jgi:hypothetical protein
LTRGALPCCDSQASRAFSFDDVAELDANDAVHADDGFDPENTCGSEGDRIDPQDVAAAGARRQQLIEDVEKLRAQLSAKQVMRSKDEQEPFVKLLCGYYTDTLNYFLQNGKAYPQLLAQLPTKISPPALGGMSLLIVLNDPTAYSNLSMSLHVRLPPTPLGHTAPRLQGKTRTLTGAYVSQNKEGELVPTALNLLQPIQDLVHAFIANGHTVPKPTPDDSVFDKYATVIDARPVQVFATDGTRLPEVLPWLSLPTSQPAHLFLRPLSERRAARTGDGFQKN